MKISQAGVDAIKQYEALRLHAYLDGGGVWTIGWGHTSGVYPGDECTEEEAQSMFEWDVAEVEDAINMYVDVDLEQGEYDALVSLAFNIGVPAFHGSTLLRLLNQDNKRAASLQFPRWNKDNGKVIKGLVRRREAERKMFLGLS